MHVVDDAAGTTGRAQVQADITILRAGVAMTDLTARTSMYWRGPDDTDEIYVSGTHTVDLEDEDQIEVRFSVGGPETQSWLIGGGESEISVVKLGGSGSGDTSQQQASGGLIRTSILTSPNSPFPLHTTADIHGPVRRQ